MASIAINISTKDQTNEELKIPPKKSTIQVNIFSKNIKYLLDVKSFKLLSP